MLTRSWAKGSVCSVFFGRRRRFVSLAQESPELANDSFLHLLIGCKIACKGSELVFDARAVVLVVLQCALARRRMRGCGPA